MSIMEKVRVKKMDKGEYKVIGRAGRMIKLFPEDLIKHQADPIGAEFDVLVQGSSPTTRVFRKTKKAMK